MKIEHLKDRIKDYTTSIETVIEKKILWKSKTSELLLRTLKSMVEAYNIGWRVQELNWMHSSEAINITFDSFPPELIDRTNQIPSYQFIQGGTLVFSQSYSGDVYVFILFPIVEHSIPVNNSIDLGVFSPREISRKLIIEKVDEFLKEMIKWEVPALKNKVGFQS